MLSKSIIFTKTLIFVLAASIALVCVSTSNDYILAQLTPMATCGLIGLFLKCIKDSIKMIFFGVAVGVFCSSLVFMVQHQLQSDFFPNMLAGLCAAGTFCVSFFCLFEDEIIEDMNSIINLFKKNKTKLL